MSILNQTFNTVCSPVIYQETTVAPDYVQEPPALELETLFTNLSNIFVLIVN